jgi:hypothetical protein
MKNYLLEKINFKDTLRRYKIYFFIYILFTILFAIEDENMIDCVSNSESVSDVATLVVCSNQDELFRPIEVYSVRLIILPEPVGIAT